MLKNLAVVNLHLFAMFYTFSLVHGEPVLLTSFGFPMLEAMQKPVIISLLLFGMLYTPIEAAISFAMTLISRHFEFQSDTYAAERGHGHHLIEGLKKMTVENAGISITIFQEKASMLICQPKAGSALILGLLLTTFPTLVCLNVSKTSKKARRMQAKRTNRDYVHVYSAKMFTKGVIIIVRSICINDTIDLFRGLQYTARCDDLLLFIRYCFT